MVVIDQARGQNAWLDIGQVVEVRKHAKKERGQTNKGFIIWDKTPKNDLWSYGTKGEFQSGQYSSILPTRVANHSTGFGSSCPLTELVIKIKVFIRIPRPENCPLQCIPSIPSLRIQPPLIANRRLGRSADRSKRRWAMRGGCIRRLVHPGLEYRF